VAFERLSLQLPRTTERAHYVRCEVTVHEFPEGPLGVSYQGRLLARYARDGQLLPAPAPCPAAERKTQPMGTARPLSPRTIGAPGAFVSAAARPTPRVSTTPGGATAHTVDGDTTKPRHRATYATLSHTAVHNVDSSFSHRRPSKLRALRTLNRKPKKNRRQISV